MTNQELAELNSAIWTALEPDKPIAEIDWPCYLDRIDGLTARAYRNVNPLNRDIAWPCWREPRNDDLIAIPDYTSWAGMEALLAATIALGWAWDFHVSGGPATAWVRRRHMSAPEAQASAETLPLAAARAAKSALQGGD